MWTQLIVNDTVFVGGEFTRARPAGSPKGGPGEVVRHNALAYTLSTGVMTTWDPSPNGAVRAYATDGLMIYAGGSSPGYGMAATDPTTGASRPWKVNGLIRNGGVNGAILSLSSGPEGVFGTGYDYGQGANFEGMFRASWADGTLIWLEDCHGDTYSAVPANCPGRPRVPGVRTLQARAPDREAALCEPGRSAG